MCILSVYTLLKVVGYYDLSVLSMSVMGLKKKFGWGVGGWERSIQVLTLQSLPCFLLHLSYQALDVVLHKVQLLVLASVRLLKSYDLLHQHLFVDLDHLDERLLLVDRRQNYTPSNTNGHRE